MQTFNEFFIQVDHSISAERNKFGQFMDRVRVLFDDFQRLQQKNKADSTEIIQLKDQITHLKQLNISTDKDRISIDLQNNLR